MIITQLPNLNINHQQYRKTIRPHFCAEIKTDIFEKNNPLKTNIKLFNAFTNTYCDSKVYLNLNEPRKFALSNPKEDESDLIVDYNPSRTGFITDKRTGRTINVNILKSTQENFEGFTSYHFVSKDLKHEYGYVTFYEPDKNESRLYGLSKDYPEYGIVGERLEVLYLQNNNDNKIGGIGKLADKIAVQHCFENNIEPNIISYADINSHVAHYKRGKRFILPEENSPEYEFLNKKYGETDPNRILEKLIDKSDETGDDVDLSGWGCLIMYLPKNFVEAYKPISD